MGDEDQALSGEASRALLRGRLVTFQRRIAELSAELEQREAEADSRQATLLVRLIEILDAFENLDETIQRRKDALDKPARRLARSVGLIHRKLQRVLEQSGVAPMELSDGLARRETCTVVETRRAAGRPDKTVLDVVRRGYRLGAGETGRVLRKAEVITVRNEG